MDDQGIVMLRSVKNLRLSEFLFRGGNGIDAVVDLGAQSRLFTFALADFKAQLAVA